MDEFVCCEDFQWMIDQGFYIKSGKFYIVTELKNEKGSGTSFAIIFCPHCGEGEMSFNE
jgi:hypothetical protein